MCQIALIILAIMGLCGGISIKNLSIGVLIATGIQMVCETIVHLLKENR